MAVDFAKTGAPAEMPRTLKPKEFPDFLDRFEKSTYVSQGPLGKLYRSTINFIHRTKSTMDDLSKFPPDAFDPDLIVDGYETFLLNAEIHKEVYLDKMGALLNYYGAEKEVEILTGDFQKKSVFAEGQPEIRRGEGTNTGVSKDLDEGHERDVPEQLWRDRAAEAGIGIVLCDLPSLVL